MTTKQRCWKSMSVTSCPGRVTVRVPASADHRLTWLWLPAHPQAANPDTKECLICESMDWEWAQSPPASARNKGKMVLLHCILCKYSYLKISVWATIFSLASSSQKELLLRKLGSARVFFFWKHWSGKNSVLDLKSFFIHSRMPTPPQWPPISGNCHEP